MVWDMVSGEIPIDAEIYSQLADTGEFDYMPMQVDEVGPYSSRCAFIHHSSHNAHTPIHSRVMFTTNTCHCSFAILYKLFKQYSSRAIKVYAGRAQLGVAPSLHCLHHEVAFCSCRIGQLACRRISIFRTKHDFSRRYCCAEEGNSPLFQ